MATLNTAYQDSVWEGLRKFSLTNNTDGSISLTDVTEYEVEGSFFGATDANATNRQVNGITGGKAVTLSVSGWSSGTTTIDGVAYYTYVLSGLTIYTPYPDVMIGASGTLPTSAEETAFSAIQYAYANESGGTITFYAVSKPTAAVPVVIKGVS